MLITNDFIGDFTLKVFNSLGTELFLKTLIKTDRKIEYSVDFSTQMSGLYFTSVVCGNKVYFQKFMIVK